jgi:hypothetical protein
MSPDEPRSFANRDEESPPKDVLCWAALFRATPAETEKAMRQVGAGAAAHTSH